MPGPENITTAKKEQIIYLPYIQYSYPKKKIKKKPHLKLILQVDLGPFGLVEVALETLFGGRFLAQFLLQRADFGVELALLLLQ